MVGKGDLLTLDEVAEILKVSKVTLWRYMRAGRITPTRLSSQKVFVSKKELDRFITAATRQK